MEVSLECGCGASLSIDCDDDQRTWFFTERFGAAHVVCGFVTSGLSIDVSMVPETVDVVHQRHPAFQLRDRILSGEEEDEDEDHDTGSF